MAGLHLSTWPLPLNTPSLVDQARDLALSAVTLRTGVRSPLGHPLSVDQSMTSAGYLIPRFEVRLTGFEVVPWRACIGTSPGPGCVPHTAPQSGALAAVERTRERETGK